MSAVTKMYSPTIHALRGIAAMMVVAYHVTNYASEHGRLLSADNSIRKVGEWGAHGVFMFFVISGCVIPLSMMASNYSLGAVHRFLARRWVRIELPYIAAIFAFLVFHYINCRVYMWNFDFEPLRFAHHLIYTVPFSKFEWYNVVFWTLAIEFQFYVLLAVIFPLLQSGKKWMSIAAIIIFSSSALLLDDNRFIFFYSASFGMGMSVYLRKVQRIQDLELWLLLTVSAGIAWWIHGWEIALVGITSALVINYIVLDGRIFRFLGKISYSLYLIHGVISGNLLYWTLPYAGPEWEVKALLLIASILLAIPAAWLFWFLFEQPAQKLSKRIKIAMDRGED